MFWALRARRLRYRRRLADNPLRQCWDSALPGAAADWRALEFLAVDIETSSLDPRQGEWLSIGWAVLSGGRVRLADAEHLLLAPARSVGQSATIHQIRDCELTQGVEPAVALEQLLRAAAGRVLVFHYAKLDLAFLNLASATCYGAPLLLPHLDTLSLERDMLQRQGRVLRSGDLKLASCRRRYHLPDYPPHNALIDAVATAELLLAQLRCRSRGGSLRLRDIG